MKVLPRWQDKRQAVDIVREIEGHLFLYLSTVTCINLGLGTLVGVAMYLLGMPNPILWGAMAALVTFIPILAICSALSSCHLVAALTFDDVGWMSSWSAAAYGDWQSWKARLSRPMILGERLEINPVVLLVGLMLWGWIWGIGGALFAVPILVAFKIFCDHVEPLSSVGDFIGK